MLLHQLCAVLAAAALSGAAPSSVKHVLHEKRDKSALDWVKGDRVESNAILPVRIGLTQNNLEKGYDYLMDVYALDD
jgi:tripeptidyl-peptidase-1